MYSTNEVWGFDFTTEEWSVVSTNPKEPHPSPRYGQTQIAVDSSHMLIISGCSSPNDIFNDIWLLTITTDRSRQKFGTWSKVKVLGTDAVRPNEIHYAGVMVCSVLSYISVYLKFKI